LAINIKTSRNEGSVLSDKIRRSDPAPNVTVQVSGGANIQNMSINFTSSGILASSDDNPKDQRTSHNQSELHLPKIEEGVAK